MILSVGYRVNSKRGIAFRRWASPIYRITYSDCREMVNHMEDTFKSYVFGGEVYPSLEEKAANLLYFMIKDPPSYMVLSL